MMYRWEPDMIRYMRDASEHSRYNRELVTQMLPTTNILHMKDMVLTELQLL